MNPLDPTTTAKLLALPSLREQAEREYASRVQTQVQDLAMQRAARLRGTEVEARLLADLTRWQSQAWALREIGRLAGFKTISDSVPTIRVIPDEKRAILVVECGPEAMCFNLPEITTRPAALAAILLHLSESR